MGAVIHSYALYHSPCEIFGASLLTFLTRLPYKKMPHMLVAKMQMKPLSVRLSESEKQRLQAEAELANVGISTLVRNRALGQKTLVKMDLKLISELRHLHILLLNIHAEKGGACSQEILSCLHAIKIAVEGISSDRQKNT